VCVCVCVCVYVCTKPATLAIFPNKERERAVKLELLSLSRGFKAGIRTDNTATILPPA